MCRINKVVLCVLISAGLFAVTQPVFAADSLTAYLFAYFTGNSREKGDEAIRFAISDDAHTFKHLNNNRPILNSALISTSGGVRDPHILRGEDNGYYMVATDMLAANGWASNRGIVMLRSTNLIDWESSTVNIPRAFPAYEAADRVWAPQTIYDPSAGKYMIYFAMRLGPNDKDKIYYAYANSTFTKLETAPKLLYKYGNNSAIDADIIYKDSTFHLFFKTEQSGNGIKSAHSTKLTEGYVLYDKYLQLTNDAVEGSCVFKLINSGTWVLMYDVYNSGRYEFALSTDLKNFTKDPKPVSFDFAPRHGTVIPITEREKVALLNKWGETDIKKRSVKPYSLMPIYPMPEKTSESASDKVFRPDDLLIFDLSGKKIPCLKTPGITAKIKLPVSAGAYHIVHKSRAGDPVQCRVLVR